jgi:hypothetical protein
MKEITAKKQEYYEKRQRLIESLYRQLKNILPLYYDRVSSEEIFDFDRCCRRYALKCLVHYDYDTLSQLFNNTVEFNNFVKKCVTKAVTFIKQKKQKYEKK